MNDNELLEQELTSLGNELRKPPSIAQAVMRQISSVPRSEGPAESPVVLNGHANPHDLQTTTKPAPVKLGLRPLASLTIAAATIAATVLVVLILRTDSIAFAQVSERLAAVRTATFTMTHSVVKRLPGGEAAPMDIKRNVSVRDDGSVRIDWPEGQVTITSPADFTRLEIDPAKSTATRRYLYEIENPEDIVARLRSLHQTAESEQIAAKEVDGMRCPGFRIEEPDSTLLIWVNPNTRLPISVERSYAKAITSADHDVVSVTDHYDDMKFDVPLSDEWFSVTPPEGYVVTTLGTPPADRRETESTLMVVTPNVGIGPLKFGTSRSEILRMLGKPDSESITVPVVPIDDKTSSVGGIERPPGASLVVLTKLYIMSYPGLGLTLTVEAVDGLRGIQCSGQESVGATVRTYLGATDKGIRIGSSAEDVIAAYGEPDENPSGSKERHGNLKYRQHHLEFVMSQKRTVQFINISDSYEHQLRFEWQLPAK